MTFDVMNCQLPTSVLTIWLQVIYLPDLKMKCMEFVCIETKTFEDMCIALELLKKKVETLSQRHLPKRLDKWLDNQEVCAILRISPRTLQSLRSTGALSLPHMAPRSYYLENDVMKVEAIPGTRLNAGTELENSLRL